MPPESVHRYPWGRCTSRVLVQLLCVAKGLGCAGMHEEDTALAREASGCDGLMKRRASRAGQSTRRAWLCGFSALEGGNALRPRRRGDSFPAPAVPFPPRRRRGVENDVDEVLSRGYGGLALASRHKLADVARLLAVVWAEEGIARAAK